MARVIVIGSVPLPSAPLTRSAGLATNAARLEFTAQPKFDIVDPANSNSALRRQSGQCGTAAVERLTTHVFDRDDPAAVLIRGGSCIIGPLGELLAGPVFDAPAILTAEIDVGAISRASFDLDVVGHYARPDLFQLTVNTAPTQPVRFLD